MNLLVFRSLVFSVLALCVVTAAWRSAHGLAITDSMLVVVVDFDENNLRTLFDRWQNEKRKRITPRPPHTTLFFCTEFV